MAAKKTVEEEQKSFSVEEAFQKIEEKIKSLEAEDITLEESFKQYQEGMKLLKDCHEAIAAVEKKVQVIAQDGSLEDFD
jgi:exodeoxyribonuclease VII small subunit